MNRKESPQSVIDSYRRRQQMAPYFLMGLALLLVVVGIIVLVVWFTGANKGQIGSVSLFATPTPTVTSSATATPVTPTATWTSTPTVTVTPTETLTPTPSGPFEYKIVENDNCWDIAAKYKVSLEVLLALNNFGAGCPITVGQTIFIPQPGAELPTATALPPGMTGMVDYTVQSNDTLAVIADKLNSTVDAIKQENKIVDENKIKAGDILKVPVNIITPTVTKAASLTPTTAAAAATATATAKP